MVCFSRYILVFDVLGGVGLVLVSCLVCVRGVRLYCLPFFVWFVGFLLF